MKKRISVLLALVSVLAIMIVIYMIYQNQQFKEDATNDIHSVAENDKRNLEKHSPKTWQETITLSAIGDILIHDRVYNDAYNGSTYDFKKMLQPVKDTLLSPDILMANQETLLGGVELGLSSYPTFNSPIEVGEALIDSGVDIVSTANNHTLDRGEKAIQNSIKFYEENNLPYVGHYKDLEDQKTLRILNNKGIKIAYLSYTYGTNGIPVPEGKDYLVNLIDLKVMKEEIDRAKQEADVIVMSIHWGNEYQRYPSDAQRLIADELASYGVDIIFGHHPHVLQPMEWIEKDGHKTFVVYSLGNFLSGQIWDYKDIGGMASIKVTKTVTASGSNIEISEPDFYPTFVTNTYETNRKFSNYKVVPLKDAGAYGLKNAQSTHEEIMNFMFQWLDQ